MAGELAWRRRMEPAPCSLSGLLASMAADPYRAGHLLASSGGGHYAIGPGWLYGSSNHGASWQAVSVRQG
jgi:hypothetical protein